MKHLPRWWNCYTCNRTFYTLDHAEAHAEVFEHKVTGIR